MKKCLLPIICILFLLGCSHRQDEKVNVQILNSNGTPAHEYSTAKEVIADSYTGQNKDGMPNYIDANDTAVVDIPQNTVSNNYCGNKNSKIFHKISCSSSKKTKEENKVYFSSRDEFISKGYSPCKSCNP